MNGHLAIVQYLTQQGADKNKADHDGGTSLMMASQNGHLAVVEYLVLQGADKDKAGTAGG
jgi:ankyrin repeat protein